MEAHWSNSDKSVYTDIRPASFEKMFVKKLNLGITDYRRSSYYFTSQNTKIARKY